MYPGALSHQETGGASMTTQERLGAIKVRAKKNFRYVAKKVVGGKYEGSACGTCGGTLRRASSGNCVRCSKVYLSRWRHIKKTGLTPDQLTDMFVKQGGSCRLCLSDDPARTWRVDYNMKREPTSIICSRCFNALAAIHRSRFLAETFADYLKHNA